MVKTVLKKTAYIRLVASYTLNYKAYKNATKKKFLHFW